MLTAASIEAEKVRPATPLAADGRLHALYDHSRNRYPALATVTT